MKTRIFLFNKKVLSTVFVAFLCLILALFWVCRAVSSPQRKIPIYSVDRNDMAIALTFDCAWNDDDIQEIIKVLDKYNCKSTFFVVGDWALKYQNAVIALNKAGHEISNHSYNHFLIPFY